MTIEDKIKAMGYELPPAQEKGAFIPVLNR